MSDIPKIDIAAIPKEEYKHIFTSSGNIRGTYTHYLNIDDVKIPIGSSHLDIEAPAKRIIWSRFYPFNNVLEKPNIAMNSFGLLKYYGDVADLIELKKQYPEAEEYDLCNDDHNYVTICDISFQAYAGPLAFIKNYKRQGLGTIAHLQIIESLKTSYDNIDDFIILHSALSDERKEHLDSMNIYYLRDEDILNERNKFSIYYENLLRYVERKGLI